jgi:para-nitrobenzyl esterase
MLLDDFFKSATACVVVLGLSAGIGLGRAVADEPAPMPVPSLDGPVIGVAQGRVQGFVQDGVRQYRGLPFAAAPVGALRWHEPKPAAKWSGVRPGNVFGANCMQAEDCLYLNVQTPANVQRGDKLPVMVWIHGGAFLFGAGSQYDGTRFAKRGVVLVTLNYRLGRAGYFAHPALTRENPKGLLGNYGMMDQIAALQWVRDNIREFGGDPKNVTIFGESAGAISVNYLMLAPQAKGLFVKALSESGFGRLDAKPLAAYETFGVNYAEKLGVHGADAAAAKALRAIGWSELNANYSPIGAPDMILPMADGRLITGSAAQGFAAGREAAVPYLLGGNSDEASLTRRGLNAQQRFLEVQKDREAFLAAFDPDHGNDPARIVARMLTDGAISEPDRDLARLHAKHGNPTFVYHFSYTSAELRASWYGMPHGGEMAYVFDTPVNGHPFDAPGEAIAVAANAYWTQFAKSGDPGAAGGPQWPRFDAADEWLMEFPESGMPTPVPHFHKARLDWTENALPH